MNRRGTVLKLVIFVLVACTAGAMEFNTLTGPHVGSTHRYYAIFGGSDGVSGLRTGDPVRVAGVAVGSVQATTLLDAEHVKVAFTANNDQTLTTNTWAVVRYANLLGQRFLGLTRSGSGPGRPLAVGATIPQSQTAPALSLTALFNGFRPLFAALTPQQVNDFSTELVNLLQGQGATLDDLISKTADLTANLAQRDQTFSTVIDSLSRLLTTVAQHDDQLTGMLTALQSLTAQLHAEGPGIAGSLDGVDALTGSVAGVLGRLENHNLPQDIQDLNSVTGVIAKNSGTLGQLIGGFAAAFTTFSRVSQNGNWINVYACGIGDVTYGTPKITGADAVNSLLSGAGQSNLLSGLGISTQALAALALPVPLTIPIGRAGSSTAQTAVCS